MTMHGSLLYIEPSAATSIVPLIDELTRKMTAAFRQGTPGAVRYRGVHRCACGQHSSNVDYELPGHRQTNSLCVHYLAWHRSEVPAEHLAMVAALECGEAEPNEDELSTPLRTTQRRRNGLR